MKILNIAIALAALIGACIIGSGNIGGMGSLWDAISLAIVVIPSYFLVAASTNSYTFYKDKSSLLLFGNLALGFGFIGTLLGLIFGLAGMAMPPVAGVDPMAMVISNIAIALITVLYGLLIKYFLVIPWAHSLKDN
jgi:flagellar motor component MotA